MPPARPARIRTIQLLLRDERLKRPHILRERPRAAQPGVEIVSRSAVPLALAFACHLRIRVCLEHFAVHDQPVAVLHQQIPVVTQPGFLAQVTVGGDKADDTADFVAECRNLKVTPHVAQNLERPGGSAIDARTTQHPGYAISQRKRKRIEECFGWLKTIALLRKVRHRGIFKVGWAFTFAAAAYNLVRMRNLAIQAT